MFKPIPIDDFLFLTGFSKNIFGLESWDSMKSVVFLRDIKKITTVFIMPQDYLRALLNNVPLKGATT